MTSPQADRSGGLRERKKARTRDSIQEHAIRLFSEQGYAATTVEQIAEAAEVSPSTYFRYFPTKEDAVLYDRLDPVLIESFLRQPADFPPLRATRAAIRETFEQVSVEESAREAARQYLMFNVPELRTRLLERVVATMALLSDAVAERVGLSSDDPKVRVWSGAVMGAMLAGVYGPDADAAGEPPSAHLTADMVDRVVAALDLIEDGLPL